MCRTTVLVGRSFPRVPVARRRAVPAWKIGNLSRMGWPPVPVAHSQIEFPMKWLPLALLLFLPASAAARQRVCVCETVRAAGHGWCVRHARGLAYGHFVPTHSLFQPLAGQPVAAPPACATCKAAWERGQVRTWEREKETAAQLAPASQPAAPPSPAAAQPAAVFAALAGRFCPACRLYHVHGQAYGSWAAAALESGRPVPADPAAVKTAGGKELCAPCVQALAAGRQQDKHGFPPQPYCEPCGVGVVAGRVFSGKDAYEAAQAADRALRQNSRPHCERCAIALLTDEECRACHMRFQRGMLQKKP